MNLIKEIGESLKKSGSKISIAESCTSGYISSLITSIEGSSDFFEGGIIVYSNKSKTEVLGVEKYLIEKHTEVSEQVAKRMAEKVKEIMGTDYSIATTGYADINGYGTKKNPAGTIFLAISSPEGTIVKKLFLKESRQRNIYLTAIESFDSIKSLIKTRQVLLF